MTACRTWFVCLLVFAFATSLWGQTGSGTLTVDNHTTACLGASGFVDFDSPKFWDVLRGKIVHMNISPGYNICTAGDPSKTNNKCTLYTDCNSTTGQCQVKSNNCSGNPKTGSITGGICTSSAECPTVKQCSGGSPNNANGNCSTDADCNFTNGACTSSLECSGDTNVYIKGKTGNACTMDSDCVAPGETGCNIGTGLCEFTDTVSTSGRTGNGAIHVCYTTGANNCSEAQVRYCDNPGPFFANVNHPPATQTFSPAFLRSVDSSDVPIEIPEKCAGVPNCTNQPGSLCCTLTQGAYGARPV